MQLLNIIIPRWYRTTDPKITHKMKTENDSASEAYLLDTPAKQCVDSQIWHLLRPTGQTGLVRIVRVELGFFIKSPHVILLVKGYVFPGL